MANKRQKTIKVEIDVDEAALKSGLVGMMQRVTALVEAKAVKRVPVVTSNLQNSIYSDVLADKFTGIVGASSKYARFVHEGTGIHGPSGKPYPIVPVRAKALFFPGAMHPVKKVMNPGSKAQPFLREALEDSEADIPRVCREGFARGGR